jgi:hypothetical protein
MSAIELMQRLVARDIRLVADGENLIFDGPANALDAATLAAMKEHKAELLKVLCELPPALVERPGLDLGPDGLWRWRGYIVPSRGTRPALRAYLHHWQQMKRRAA